MNRTIDVRKSWAKCASVATGAGLLGLLGVSGLLASGNALAALAPGSSGAGFYNGNGELFLSVFDSTAKISYTLDLGLNQNSFFISAQQDTGIQTFFPVTDANWIDFLSRPGVDSNNLRWSVLALDQTGGTAVGGVRLFQTIMQGDEAKLTGRPATDTAAAVPGTLINNAFTTATGTTQAGTFFNTLNNTGSHGVSGTPLDFTANGSSVNAEPEAGNTYYGPGRTGGLTTTLNGSALYDMSNKVGDSSWFYYVTRSSASNGLGIVSADEFDNLGHDGYWGFTKVGDNVDSPYKGQYLLSYTLEAYTPAAVTAAGQLRANFLDYIAGFQSRPVLSTGLNEFAGYQISSLVVPTASPVPEPSTWGLFGLGLAGLAVMARRRRV